MIKLHEIIQKASWAYSEGTPGEDGETEERAFKDGAEFVIDNIIAVKNHFPIVGIVTIQVDPIEPEKKLVSAKMSGLNPSELVDLLIRFTQGQLDKIPTGMVQQLVLMPKDEALRRQAFQDSLDVVKAGSKIIKPS